jgi:O-antigen/teichoic acid export membrane protein
MPRRRETTAPVTAAPRVRQLAGETVVYGLAGTLTRFIGVFLVPLYTRAFTPSEYGGLALITSVVGLLTTFSVLGLDNASARWFYDTADAARRRSVIASWFWCQLSVALVIALVVSVLARPVTARAMGSVAFAPALALAAWTVPLWAFTKVAGNWLRYERRPWTTAVFFAASSLATIVLVVWCVLGAGLGINGVFGGQLAAGALTALVAVLLARSRLAVRHASRAVLGQMLTFGLPLVPAAVASWVTASSDRFIVQWYHGREEVAVYAVAIAVASIVTLAVSAFQLAWGPFAFSILDHADAHRIYGRVLTSYLFVGAWLCTAVSLFAPELVAVFTTAAYAGAPRAVPYLAFAQLAIGATYIGVLGPSILKRSGPIALSIFLGAALNVALNLVLVPHLGMTGAAISTLVAYLAAAVFLFLVSQHLYPLPYRFGEAAACFGLAALLLAVGHAFSGTPGIVSLLARAALTLGFAPLGFILGILRPSDARRAWSALTTRGRLVR